MGKLQTGCMPLDKMYVFGLHQENERNEILTMIDFRQIRLSKLQGDWE